MRQFGGRWTENKLERLEKYLKAYLTLFSVNEKASRFRRIYVDGFAGSGYRRPRRENSKSEETLFEDVLEDPDAVEFVTGSAERVLSLDTPFHEYVFVDRDPECAFELNRLKQRYPDREKSILIVKDDANMFLQDWCHCGSWQRDRAVVFLDPYGMQVEWSTLEAIAGTKAIDLWLLFPIGQAVNRLLVRKNLPDGPWAKRLTTFFGTDEWKEAFYQKKTSRTLFNEDEETTTKTADFKAIKRFFVERLEKIFARVAKEPLPLRNSRNTPIFLLCFAASNPRGADTAIKIAKHLLKE